MEARRLMPAGFEKSKTFNFGAENENKHLEITDKAVYT